MKTISIIGLVIAIGGLISGIYCQLEIVPVYNNFSADGLDDLEIAVWHSYGNQKFLLGSIALFAGVFSVILGLVSGIKKEMLGWAAVIVGLVSMIFGIMQSTHMFD